MLLASNIQVFQQNTVFGQYLRYETWLQKKLLNCLHKVYIKGCFNKKASGLVWVYILEMVLVKLVFFFSNWNSRTKRQNYCYDTHQYSLFFSSNLPSNCGMGCKRLEMDGFSYHRSFSCIIWRLVGLAWKSEMAVVTRKIGRSRKDIE